MKIAPHPPIAWEHSRPKPSSILTVSVLLLFQGNCRGSRGKRHLIKAPLGTDEKDGAQWKKWLPGAAQWHRAESSARSLDGHIRTLPNGLYTPFLTFSLGIYSTGGYWALARARQVLCWPLGVAHWAKSKPCPGGFTGGRRKAPQWHPKSCVQGSLGASENSAWTNWGDLEKLSRGVGAWDYLEECLKVG